MFQWSRQSGNKKPWHPVIKLTKNKVIKFKKCVKALLPMRIFSRIILKLYKIKSTFNWICVWKQWFYHKHIPTRIFTHSPSHTHTHRFVKNYKSVNRPTGRQEICINKQSLYSQWFSQHINPFEHEKLLLRPDYICMMAWIVTSKML